MSRKERTKIRRNNYRAWKQEQKQQRSAASAPSTAATLSAAPADSPAAATSPAAPAASPAAVLSAAALPVARPETPAPADINTAFPPKGALIPYDPSAPFNMRLLFDRLGSWRPEITGEERIAIAQRLEDDVASRRGGQFDPNEKSCQSMRSLLTKMLGRFGIAWPPGSELASHAPGHSTGPRTPAGLARSSQNARTHGLSSLTSVFVLLPGEDTGEWMHLVRDLTEEFQPASRTEEILVNDLAQSHWLTQRAINLQTNSIDDPKAFALYLRYQTTHHRAYYRALKQLLALQKARAQSGAPAIPDHPAPDFDGTIDIDTISRPSNPADPAPVAPQPGTSTESLTLPQAA